MSDLVAWFRTHLDEAERLAQEAVWGDDGWRRRRDEVWAPGVPPLRVGDMWDIPTAAHIASWDPPRVLAEVAAKRAILDLRDAMAAAADAAAGTLLASAAKVRLGAYDNVVRLLALPYAGQDGYREEWRP